MLKFKQALPLRKPVCVPSMYYHLKGSRVRGVWDVCPVPLLEG